MKKINVTNNELIVVYDKIGMVSAPRAYWMMKSFGLTNVAVLNGSFSKWESEQRTLHSGDDESAWKKLTNKSRSDEDF